VSEGFGSVGNSSFTQSIGKLVIPHVGEVCLSIGQSVGQSRVSKSPVGEWQRQSLSRSFGQLVSYSISRDQSGTQSIGQ
jgi:hypothetical protein